MRSKAPTTALSTWQDPFYLGIDVGGTFSDFFLVSKTGASRTFKYFSSPDDPSVAVLEGLNALGESLGFAAGDFLRRIGRIVHGTTIATNALITGRTAKTGFITTAGFRDIANMRRGLRGSPFNGKLCPPPPLVQRHLIAEVEERVDCEGNVVRGLETESIRRAIDKLDSEGVESIAVSLLFSFLEPAHEKLIAEIINDANKDVFLSVSHEVLPQIGAYERHCTTIINAKVGPVIDQYLERLSAGLQSEGFNGELYIMQSNGGVSSPTAVRRFPVNTLLSGPAAGPLAATALAKGHPGILAGDMGGTSFEVSVINDGIVALTTEREVGGYRVATPGLRINSIGAGGGSIAWAEEGKILRVGPASAGSVPGPACYGKGGTRPTVTDAQIVLGYLDPAAFLGGRFNLRPELAEKVIKELGESIGLSTLETAAGIYKIVNANMAGAIRVMTIQEGVDPRDYLLVMGGGAGPLHAAAIAAELGIREVVIPRVGAVMCAVGMLMADFHSHFVRSLIRVLKAGVEKQLRHALDEMAEQADKQSRGDGKGEKFSTRTTLDLRYSGQFHEIEIAFNKLDVVGLKRAFNEKHERLYGYSVPDGDVEVVNVHLYWVRQTKKPAPLQIAKSSRIDQAYKNKRKVFFGNKFISTPIYDGSKLGAGARIDGPCLIEFPDTAVVVQPDCRARLDDSGNINVAVDL